MAVIIEDFVSAHGAGIDYWRNGVVIDDGAKTYYLTETEDIDFRIKYNPIAIYNEETQTVIFTAPSMSVQKLWNYGTLTFNGDTTINGEIELEKVGSYSAPIIYFNGNTILNCSISTSGSGQLNFSEGYLNADSLTWSNTNQDIVFGTNAQLQITSSSNGKTLIKANEISGTITLDVQSGVNEGYTFSIEATNNQLVITDGEWTATPSTVGNVTTYTLAKAGPSKKQRLFYTIENGVKKMRFLTDSNGKQRLLGGL